VSVFYIRCLDLCLFQFEIQAQTAVSRLNQPVVFQDRNVDDVQDGYVNFDPRKHKYVTVMRRRTDVAVQVTSFICCMGQSK
jgi:uridine kinase